MHTLDIGPCCCILQQCTHWLLPMLSHTQAIASLKRQLLEALSVAELAPPGLRASWVERLGRQEDGSDGVRIALQNAGGGPRRGRSRSIADRRSR